MSTRSFILGLLSVGVLAGCATSGTSGVQADDLRRSVHFVTETVISDLDFPSLQRNLYKHRAACGTAPRFVMHEGQTSFASLIETQEIPESYENVVLADLTQYLESMRAPKRVAVRVYSYYYNDEVQERVDRMMGAVRRPGVCEP